jgi:prepilin-type N-terminal cleavage/methylation domain-containing protein
MKTRNAFTLVELVIVLSILGILLGLAVPTVLDARNRSRAAAAGSACRAIETAKNLWKKDFPGAPITNADDLKRYFPGGNYPPDPWGVAGTPYLNVTDLTKPTQHAFNGNCAYEPVANCNTSTDADNNGVKDILENGFNDAAQP